MRAATVVGKEMVEIQDIAKPAIKDNEVLIKVASAGVCGSDLHLFQGTHAFRKAPAILGHEATGTVVEAGKAVTAHKIGDRVTVEPHAGCGKCEFCITGSVNLCLNKTSPGTDKWIGTFVEYFNAPESAVYKLADSVSDDIGVLIEPLAVAVHALERATVKARDCLVILGAGSIGLLTQVVAKDMGFKTIITTDTAPYNREISLRLGAHASLDPLAADVVAAIMEATGGRGADLAIVAAGADTILDQASSCVRKRGEIGIVAMITKHIPFYSYGMVFKEQTMYGAMTYETRDFRKAAELINGGLDLSGFITHKLPLDQSQQALDILSRKQENVIKVLVGMIAPTCRQRITNERRLHENNIPGGSLLQ